MVGEHVEYRPRGKQQICALKAAVSLDWHDYVMGKTKFATNQSLYQTAYVGELQPDAQFKILWQSKGPIFPQPYDPLTFPGKKCVIK